MDSDELRKLVGSCFDQPKVAAKDESSEKSFLNQLISNKSKAGSFEDSKSSKTKVGKENKSSLQQLLASKSASESFFPHKLRSDVLVLSSTKFPEKDMITIIFGTITQGYPTEMFSKDVEAAKKHFSNTKEENFHIIQMVPEAGSMRSLDSKDATQKVEAAIQKLNEQQTNTKSSTLRVIRIGIASTIFQIEALIFIIKEWSCPPEEKCIEFVTAGDSEDHEMTNLCKILVLNKDVKEILFYNTEDYHPFGKIKSSDSLLSGNSGIGNLKKITE